MKILKTLVISLITLTSSFTILMAASPALAVDIISPVCPNPFSTPADQIPAVCKDNQTTSGDNNSDNPLFGPSGIITKVMQIVVGIVGIIAVVTLILSSIKIITSAGNADGAASGRRGVIYSLIGLLIVVLAQAIVTFVLSKL